VEGFCWKGEVREIGEKDIEDIMVMTQCKHQDDCKFEWITKEKLEN